MKRTIALVFALSCLCLTGCSGATVIYQELPPAQQTQPAPQPEEPDSGAVKTGLAILTDTTGSDSGEEAAYDVTVAAVTVDEGGVIRSCVIDGYDIEVPFDTTGTVTGDVTALQPSRRETSDVWAGRAQQAARYAVGKTAAQLQTGGDDEEEELLSVVVRAVGYARHMGAQEDDELRLALTADLSGSTSATGSEAGRVRLDCDAAAVTFRGETITSCRIDSVQADVTFDAMGTITDALPRHVKTKNELGKAYGMKANGGAQWEWYEQAAAFGDYVRGRTVAQVLEIPVSDGKPAQADLAASVTISVTPFQQLLARAGGYGER